MYRCLSVLVKPWNRRWIECLTLSPKMGHNLTETIPKCVACADGLGTSNSIGKRRLNLYEAGAWAVLLICCPRLMKHESDLVLILSHCRTVHKRYQRLERVSGCPHVRYQCPLCMSGWTCFQHFRISMFFSYFESNASPCFRVACYILGLMI